VCRCAKPVRTRISCASAHTPRSPRPGPELVTALRRAVFLEVVVIAIGVSQLLAPFAYAGFVHPHSVAHCAGAFALAHLCAELLDALALVFGISRLTKTLALAYCIASLVAALALADIPRPVGLAFVLAFSASL